jgi:precorrin-6B methylase 2
MVFRRRSWRSVALTITTLLGLGIGLLAGPAMGQVKLDVPFVPTPQAVVDRMLAIAKVTANDYLIDLGSGDGRIPITAAKRYGARGLGIDIDPRRIAEANANAQKAGVTERVTFRQQNLFETPLGEATVLTMYLLESVNLKLRPRLLKELKPGTRVVSHAFNMGNWQPDKHQIVDGNDIYLWIVPAQVDGRWILKYGDQNIDVVFRQNFQRLTGSATVGGRSMALEKPSLRGEQISFVLNLGKERRKFTGRIVGDAIEPIAEDAAKAKGAGVQRADGWRATRG